MTEAKLEQALRELYEQTGENIARDEAMAEEYARQTDLRHGFHKQQHERIKERSQREWYTRDALRMLANRGGIKL